MSITVVNKQGIIDDVEKKLQTEIDAHEADITNPHSVTAAQASAVAIADIADNLTTDDATKVLSAKQGKVLEDGKVDKVEGKALSTNDYTDEEKTKLTGIEALAEVNIVEGVKVDNVLLTPDVDRIVNVDLSGKVDKVEGKALSTNDYTDEEKSLVATIPSISLKNAEQEKRIANIEENLRRVNNGEVSATVTGERVIYLGKDVANTPLKMETEGYC